MKVIVTGSSGFIGSHLSALLLKSGYEVLGIDSHSDYYSPELKNLRMQKLAESRHFHFLKVDLCDSRAINEAVKQVEPDAIFHLAAQAGVRIPVADTNKYVQSNLVGFSVILQAAVLNKVPKFLYASSSSVYGDSATIPYNESERILNPNSFYGATKLSNESLANALVKDSLTRARGMRFFTVYGPSGRPDMAYFRIISSLINGTEFQLFGDGSIERDFTFIEDCVKMISLLGEELGKHEAGFSDVVNIGGGQPVSISKLIEIASDLLNSEISLSIHASNPKDVFRTMADSSRLTSLIGVKPERKLEDGLEMTIQWAKDDVTPLQLMNWAASTS
jgi:UDP-glucuronate 4-epimerase